MTKQVKWQVLVPYLLIFSFNGLNALLFPVYNIVYIKLELLLLVSVVYYLATRMRNMFNKIISFGWIVFFFLGILNINSIKQQTDHWNLEIYYPTLLYFFCLLIFNISILFFEKIRFKKRIFKDDLFVLTKSPFPYIILLYPILLFITSYISLGFLPILIGESFVDEMYEYNYGILYGFKFVCVYSFSLAVINYKFFGIKKIIVFYLLFILFVDVMDGKRFVLLLSLILFFPLYYVLNKQNEKTQKSSMPNNNLPIILICCSIGIVYMLLNILRTGGDLSQSAELIIKNIPFGVEYKDYVHSFNTYTPEKIKDYSFGWSAIGSFLNSKLLELFNLKKVDLYQMGSQHAWMKLYDEKFGIRTGIIAELYFAYGLFVLPLMSVIAFFTNYVSNRILNPKSYFNLIQSSILFGLIFLLINGQATVFFGCLTMILYIYILYNICKRFPINK